MGPSFVNLLSLSEIYTRKVVACDFQVQIKRAIENSLLSKLSYETILLQLHLFTLQYRVHYRLQFTLDRIICLLCVYICHWHYICTMWQKKKCPNNEKEICTISTVQFCFSTQHFTFSFLICNIINTLSIVSLIKILTSEL